MGNNRVEIVWKNCQDFFCKQQNRKKIWNSGQKWCQSIHISERISVYSLFDTLGSGSHQFGSWTLSIQTLLKSRVPDYSTRLKNRWDIFPRPQMELSLLIEWLYVPATSFISGRDSLFMAIDFYLWDSLCASSFASSQIHISFLLSFLSWLLFVFLAPSTQQWEQTTANHSTTTRERESITSSSES